MKNLLLAFNICCFFSFSSLYADEPQNLTDNNEIVAEDAQVNNIDEFDTASPQHSWEFVGCVHDQHECSDLAHSYGYHHHYARYDHHACEHDHLACYGQ